MTRLENDPRLTAYVLNELDPSEQADVEALLAADPAARHAAEQIRAAADRLSASLAAEPALMLDDLRRARLTEGASSLDVRGAESSLPMPESAIARSAPGAIKFWATSLAAAAAAIGLIGTGFLLPSTRSDTTANRTSVSAFLGSDIPPPAVEQPASQPSLWLLSMGTSAAAESQATPYPENRFDFPAQGHLSYGYQLPYGKTNSNERLVAREAFRTEVEGFYGPRQLGTLGYGGDFEAENSVVLKLDNLSAGDSQKILAALSRRGANQPSGVEFQAGGYLIYGRNGADQTKQIESGDSFGLPVLGDIPALGSLFVRDKIAELGYGGGSESAGEALFKVRSLPDLDALIDSAEAYSPIYHNPFLPASANPLSTFSIDVDTASYANIRRYLLSGQLPPPSAVRYPPPDADAGADGEAPFSANLELAACPWAPQHRLVRIGLRGWEPSEEQRPTANLVFLLDVSGSMQPPNKLPLVVESLKLLLGRLRDDDRVALAVYAGASGLVLPSTPAREQAAIEAALDNLSAGGSTNGGQGINLAYAIAAENFIQGGINRVILCTDGDFNVGVANRDDLQKLIEEKARTGVFLSVFGFGMGNLKDATLETLADRGNGNYAYIDSIEEARKVLVEQMGGTLQTIAKDVKIQVEFNPAAVAGYRLLGYENRMLAARDFNDDTKDAGEIGAGHTVTALYEIVPAGGTLPDVPQPPSAGVPQPPSADVPQPPSAAGSAPRAGAWGRRNAPSPQPSPGVPGEGEGWLPLPVLRERAGVRAETLNDVVPPPPTPIDLAAETPEMLAPDPEIDPLKYQTPAQLVAAASGEQLELLTLKLRYKAPEGEQSRRIEFALDDASGSFDEASPEFRFAAAVAGFAMKLRGTPFADGWTLDAIAETALTSLGDDPDRYRTEFLTLVKQAELLQAQSR
ncbi:MAG: von Willebrand factor type A domain-containing protein [Planctomycetes bacterium]|nr:von Willebrand factor type A domain-containing protein [Planctomycetota bacterium]